MLPQIILKIVSVSIALFPQYCLCKEYIDLSYDIGGDTAVWPTGLPYTRETLFEGYTPDGYWFENYQFCSSEHLGTHMDAPSHFAKGKWSVADIPLTNLIGTGVVIDITEKVSEDPNALLTKDDLMAWIDIHGPLPDNVVVFVRTGWGSRYGNKLDYFGTATNDTSTLTFPGIRNDVAQYLVGVEVATGNKVIGVGIDTPSLDHGPSEIYETHQTLYEANIYGLENVANLDKLPEKGFDVLVLPMKLRGGSGAPTRIIATIPGENSATLPTLASSLMLIVAYHLLQLI